MAVLRVCLSVTVVVAASAAGVASAQSLADDIQTTALLNLPALSAAQIEGPAPVPPTPRHTGVKALFKNLVSDVKHLPSKENMYLALGGGVLALAVHPLDDNVQGYLSHASTARRVFRPGQEFGRMATLLGAASTVYAVGRVKDQPRVSHVGMDLLRALAVSEGLTQVIKTSTRRERPDGSTRNSFPSGHAADTFAFATALERHLGWHYAVPAYAFSSYVAFSRLPANRHWFSDAMFGTAVGVIAGRTVTSFEANKYPIQVRPVAGGAEIVFTRRSRS
jgi:membrane-associated phospholipid phosphatase